MVWGSTFAKRFALCKSYPLLLFFDGFGLFSRNRASLFPTQLVHQCSSYSRASVFPISVPHTVVRHCSSSVFLIQSCVIVPCQCSSYNRASVFPTQPVLQCFSLIQSCVSVPHAASASVSLVQSCIWSPQYARAWQLPARCCNLLGC